MDSAKVAPFETAAKVAKQDLSWRNVQFTAGTTKILTDCWGHVPAGKVCAIMGPSGAGKSSLLNVIAGRSASAPGIKVTGDYIVGGVPIQPVSFRTNIAYVMQDDAITPTSTPREALRFSATMRLPSLSQKQIEELVTKLIKDLGLEDCADTMVGGALIKGISGGQRKRTSVGIEVITQPSLLFLDEPTSGLDSYAAFNCVNLLKKLAENNAAVLCTIHQPSSEVFHLFDLVIVMKAGRVLYQGPVTSLTDHFEMHGFECPENYNPADYAMFVAQTSSIEVLESSGFFIKQSEDAVSTSSKTPSDQSIILPPVKCNLYRQVSQLTYREWLITTRDTAALGTRLGLTVFLNVLFGLIFLNAGNRDDSDPSNLGTHFGGITMVMIICMFGMAQPVMLNFPYERPIFLREYSTGTYGAPAYMLAKVFLELPLCFIQTLMIFILNSFMMKLQGQFILLVLAGWGLGVTSAAMAVTLGCVVKDVKDVTEMAPLLYVPQLLFAGFFIKTTQIPVFLRWAQYLCGLKYSMNLVLLNEFAASNRSCQGSAASTCSKLISQNDIHKDRVWIYILILVALFVFFRLLAGMLLVQRAKRFY